MGTRDDFLRDLRVLARKRGLLLVIDTKRGKGSHLGVSLGNRRTTLPMNIQPHTRRSYLKQLGIEEE